MNFRGMVIAAVLVLIVWVNAGAVGGFVKDVISPLTTRHSQPPDIFIKPLKPPHPGSSAPEAKKPPEPGKAPASGGHDRQQESFGAGAVGVQSAPPRQ